MRAALVAKLQTAARSDLSADDWAALSKSDVVDRWLTRTIKGFDVSDLANKEIAKLRAFKQGSMTTEIYFQELQSVMTATRLIYHIAYEEVPNEVATEADRCRLALMGLAPAIRSKLMQDHASTIAKAKASNRPLDPGYTQSGFDSWSLLEQLAKSFKRNQQTGAGSDPQPGKEEEDPFSVQIGAKRRSAINKQRLSYVAGKFEIKMASALKRHGLYDCHVCGETFTRDHENDIHCGEHAGMTQG